MDTLSLKMAEMYGHRWTGSVGVSFDQQHAWATVLGGITAKQIACGLGVLALGGASWPPSAPEFRAMCLSGEADSLDLPSEAEAFREACAMAHPSRTGNWSHPVVRHAAMATGMWELMHNQADVTRRIFAVEYARAKADALAGRAFPDPATLLPETVEVHATPEQAQAARDQLKAILGRARSV
jgi:hypothetical protein